MRRHIGQPNMNHTIAQDYKAELLVHPPSPTIPLRFSVNGGCLLPSKCSGTGDYVAEEIQMTLPNSATITATWIPRKYRDGSSFTCTFAGYAEPDGSFMRFDNAHNRDVLHADSQYHGQSKEHEENIELNYMKSINRRRIALVRLMETLEQNVNWRIPVWFYMPWCMWWSEYADFPEKLFNRKPQGVLLSNICEAVMAYVCFNPNTSKQFLTSTGITRQTLDDINEAIERVTFSIANTGTFEFRQIVFGHLLMVPFPMYAPPGSKLEGPIDVVEPLLAD